MGAHKAQRRLHFNLVRGRNVGRAVELIRNPEGVPHKHTEKPTRDPITPRNYHAKKVALILIRFNILLLMHSVARTCSCCPHK
jgi:hypothetical protein